MRRGGGRDAAWVRFGQQLRARVHPRLALVFLSRGVDGIPAREFFDRFRAAMAARQFAIPCYRKRLESAVDLYSIKADDPLRFRRKNMFPLP
jgi:hypothetical protein